MAVLWDLCSGLGGASRAFTVDPSWEVLRFENNPELLEVPFTVHRDVLEWESWFEDYPKPDFIWSSPPCLEFSQAYSAPAPTAKREGREFEPDLGLLNVSLALIERLEPRFWAIENVAGAIPLFSEAIGHKPQKAGPFFIWGNLPPIVLPPNYHHRKSDIDKRWSPIRSNIKAEIPITISKAVKASIEEQRTLTDYNIFV